MSGIRKIIGRTVVVGLLLVLVIFITYFIIIVWNVRKMIYEYNNIQLGMTSQEVIEKLGRPYMIYHGKEVGPIPPSAICQKSVVAHEQYLYFSKGWGIDLIAIYFDDQSRVSAKYINY
ncbi:hypothetical protein SDC9_195000 [bioreactor metagenome]|uniref:Lipoprotein SmpA/OmlA domain-containing protein n=1 Tax=bioreactor metagenome TaxID=1076179 RepID=A0A645I813_9ZZZZ